LSLEEKQQIQNMFEKYWRDLPLEADEKEGRGDICSKQKRK